MPKNDCPFKHDNISELFGVTPQPIEELPTTCTCGAPLTYADEVAFVTYPSSTSPTGGQIQEAFDLIEKHPLRCDQVDVPEGFEDGTPKECPRCRAPVQDTTCTLCTWPNPSYERVSTTLVRREVGQEMFTDQALEEYAASLEGLTTLTDPQGRVVPAKVVDVQVHDGQVNATFEFDPKAWK